MSEAMGTAGCVPCHGALQVGFYDEQCGANDVESIVRGVVTTSFASDQTIVAALLRLQFHDCFVTGCDASLLLDGNSTEKNASPNRSMRGYEIIDEAKAAVEALCPDLVSCADIIAIATRDAVSLAGGPSYNVQTGRRDGLSAATTVNLPSPSFTVSQSIAAFKTEGFNVNDMVLLLGAHTVGVTHCPLIQSRLYNFHGTGNPDPSMDKTLASQLRTICPNTNPPPGTPVFLDQNTSSAFVVDNDFFKQILSNRGILQIDRALALDPATRNIVTALASDGPSSPGLGLGRGSGRGRGRGRIVSNFMSGFGEAMVKMGALQVLTGSQGEIRKSCRVAN
ncbi:hypothetical protein AMTR_s00002p00129990 [Amborella trichopoda]|uniref:Peroxidase n=1 Tax=Amborella trichopoda TaxID=13333 RepID=W1NZC0_AMBTC|nr:hypothetical protein AMTR_s00002p00129990 [Amborella trichopoda]